MTEIKKNSKVSKDELLFSLELIVQMLNKESRKKLVIEFSDELEALGYTKYYIRLLLKRDRTLGNDALKRLLVNVPEAVDKAIELLRAQIEELENAIRIIENNDLSVLKDEYGPKVDEEEEEEYEEEEEEE